MRLTTSCGAIENVHAYERETWGEEEKEKEGKVAKTP